MAARFKNCACEPTPLLPQMAKEVMFWCAVLAALVSGAVLIGGLGTLA
jgi:hypothetical protein